MGAYLTRPDVTKHSQDSTVSVCGEDCQYAITTMQGWRLSMEDCCIVLPKFEDDSLLMGVFDGHGGKEVAEYCTRHFERLIKASQYYNKDGTELGKALDEAFLNCDKSLLSEEAQVELKKIIEEEVECTEDKDMEGEDQSEDELAALEKEASMPLDQVIKKKFATDSLMESLTTIANKDLKKQSQRKTSEGESSSSASCSSTSVDGSSNNNSGELIEDYEKYLQKVISRSGVSLSPRLIMSLFENDESSESEEDGDEVESDDDTSSEDSEQDNLGSEDTSNLEEQQDSGTVTNNDEGTATTAEDGATEEVGGVSTGNESDKINDREPIGKKASQRELRKRRRDQMKEENSKAKRQSLEDELTVPNDMEGYECGTTAVVCLMKGNRYIVANAGDSRCILSTKGLSKNLSEDHKPTDPIETSRIEKAGGFIDEDLRVNGGLNLSRAIGDHVYKQNETLSLQEQMISAQPDIVSAEISSDDEFILMASDGIWNCTTSQNAVSFVRQRLINMKDCKPISEESRGKPQTLSLICEELCDMCLAPNTDNDGSGCDNMTVVLLLLQPLQSLFQ